MYDVHKEDTVADARHLESLGSPVNAHQYGGNCKDGYQGAVEEVVEPRLGDIFTALHLVQHDFHVSADVLSCFLLFLQVRTHVIDQVFLLEHFHQVIQACDGHDGSQLECPPHHYLHSQQAVTCPGGKSGDDHGGGSQMAVHNVQQRQAFLMSSRQHQLPDGEA